MREKSQHYEIVAVAQLRFYVSAENPQLALQKFWQRFAPGRGDVRTHGFSDGCSYELAVKTAHPDKCVDSPEKLSVARLGGNPGEEPEQVLVWVSEKPSAASVAQMSGSQNQQRQRAE